MGCPTCGSNDREQLGTDSFGCRGYVVIGVDPGVGGGPERPVYGACSRVYTLEEEQAAEANRAALAEARRRSASHHAEIQRLHESPKTHDDMVELATRLIETNPGRAIPHVVHVEWRGLLGKRTGYAEAFRVWPVGEIRVDSVESSNNIPLGLAANGNFYKVPGGIWGSKQQAATVAMTSKMRWYDHPVTAMGGVWRPGVLAKLESDWRELSETRTPVEDAGPMHGSISQGQRARADRIRRSAGRHGMRIHDLARLVDGAPNGPKSRQFKKWERTLAKERRKHARKMARAARIDGGA